MRRGIKNDSYIRIGYSKNICIFAARFALQSGMGEMPSRSSR